jgi:hypothetical protein
LIHGSEHFDRVVKTGKLSANDIKVCGHNALLGERVCPPICQSEAGS